MNARLALLSCTVLLAGCVNVDDYYLSRSPDPEARQLYELIAAEEDPQLRAVAVERLSGFLVVEAGAPALIAYLTNLVESNPDDEFGALYLFIVAQTYLESGAAALARHYFERVVNRYADTVVRDVSLRRSSLQQLVRLTPDPENRVRYYRLLIDEYGPSLDPGLLYLRLGRAYEELGEWELAFSTYREFLQYPATEVPGEPHAYRETAARVAFHDSRKDWVVRSLEDLRRNITWALANRDVRALTRYQAGVNFFTRSWEQSFDDPNTTPTWNIGQILSLSSRLSVEPTVHLTATGNEAYLWTYGWGGLRIRTWYFYFRKVHYPPDPDIHGTWEWAGIYLGERI